MTLEDVAKVGGLLALGAPILLAALAFWMSRYFASQKELNGQHQSLTADINGLGDRVSGVQKVSEMANEQAGIALRAAERAESKSDEERRFSEERYIQILKAQESISSTNQRTADTLQQIQISQERASGITAKLVADLERLTSTVDKLVDKLGRNGTSRTRKPSL